MSTEELREQIKSNIDTINDNDFLIAIKALIDNKREHSQPDYSDENIDQHVNQIMKDNHDLLNRLAQ